MVSNNTTRKLDFFQRSQVDFFQKLTFFHGLDSDLELAAGIQFFTPCYDKSITLRH